MNLLPLLVMGGALVLLAGKSKTKQRQCPELSYGSGQLDGYDYIEFVTGGASQSEKLPIIVFFHSRGVRPAGMTHFFDGFSKKARVVMPVSNTPGPIWWNGKARDEDQMALANEMQDESRKMASFVDGINECLNGYGKPIVTGHSQGGMMALAVAAAIPNRIRAAVPVSGWLPEALWPNSLPPTYMIHGESDKTINFDRTKMFVSSAKTAGMTIDLQSIPNQGHGFSGMNRATWQHTLEWITA